MQLHRSPSNQIRTAQQGVSESKQAEKHCPCRAQLTVSCLKVRAGEQSIIRVRHKWKECIHIRVAWNGLPKSM